MIKDKNIAKNAGIRMSKILGPHQVGETFWLAGVDTKEYEILRGRVPSDKLFVTATKAINALDANQGDVLFIAPNYTETVSLPGGININKAGVAIYCLGQGAVRPKFTFSTVDATITVTAASVKMENFIVIPSVDNVVSPVVVSAPDCIIDFESQEASAIVQFTNAFLTTAAADGLNLKLRHRGFIAGVGCVNAIRLVGVDSARIEVDFYGVASTAIVEFHTTACHDINISGKFYNDGTSLTKNVLDTVTGSTWSCCGWDGNSQSNFSGGTGVALAADDVASVAAAIAVVDGYHAVPVKDAITDAVMRDVIGRKTDTAAAGAVSEAESLMAYIKQSVTAHIAAAASLVVIDEFHDVPAVDNTLNAQINEVIGNKVDAGAAGAVTATDTLVAYIKQLVTDAIAATAAIGIVDGLHDVPVADAVTNLYMRDVVGIKTDAAVGAAAVNKSLMGYVKGIVTDTAVIGALGAGLTDLGGMSTGMKAEVNTEVDGALNTAVPLTPTGNSLNDILSKLDGANTFDNTTDSLEAIRDRIDTLNTADQVDLDAILADTITIGDAALPVAPVAGSLARFIASGGTALGAQLPDSKSLYDMVKRYGEGDVVTKALATGVVGVANLFTVTGEVEVVVVGYIDTAVTSAGALTLEAGVAGATAGLIAQAGKAALLIDLIWVDATPAVLVAKPAFKVIANGANIIQTVGTADATAGGITYYCYWRPLSADGNVVAA